LWRVASRFVWNLKWPQLPADFDPAEGHNDQIARQDDDDREDSERAEPAQGHGDAIVHRRNA